MGILPTTTVLMSDVKIYCQELLGVISIQVAESRSTILTLTGDLGAGKTTFVQSLAGLLGVTEMVTSPTFVVMKRYETSHPVFHSLVHIDAYRIENSMEMKPLRFDEILGEPGTLVCIEWAERIADIIPTNTYHLNIETVNETTRTIDYERR